MASTRDVDPMLRFQHMVPKMGGNYKGSHGKVAVVGGCLEFTGAPFFAAMSALRVGADMAYVICTPSAATAIKSYSPELMVLPYLPELEQQQYDSRSEQRHYDGAAADESGRPVDGDRMEAAVQRAVTRIAPWLARASAVVVGPGLGDDPVVCATASALITHCRTLGLPLVVDGSALTHIVAKSPGLVAGYRPCLLTPNVAELGRIAGAVGVQLPGRMSDEWLPHAPRVAQAFDGPVVLAKGVADLVCTPDDQPPQQQQPPSPNHQPPHPPVRYVCEDLGSPRRCGGQGDVLAGTAAAFLCWAAKHQQQQHASATASAAGVEPPTEAASANGISTDDVAVCALVASRVVRKAAASAFEVGQRGMVAGDILPELNRSFVEVTGRA